MRTSTTINFNFFIPFPCTIDCNMYCLFENVKKWKFSFTSELKLCDVKVEIIPPNKTKL